MEQPSSLARPYTVTWQKKKRILGEGPEGRMGRTLAWQMAELDSYARHIPKSAHHRLGDINQVTSPLQGYFLIN